MLLFKNEPTVRKILSRMLSDKQVKLLGYGRYVSAQDQKLIESDSVTD